MRAAVAGFAGLFAVLCSAPIALAENKVRISITRQPGIPYLVSHVMETRKLIEKQSAADGVEGVSVEWRTFSGGGAQTDALLSGSVDIVNTGTGNLLLLWDRTKGRVKGIVASSSLPLIMVSSDPRIRSLDDITPNDKIAVPTIGISSQAILLQMAAIKRYGDGQARRFDANTVQLGHPDAVAAIFNAAHEVKNHFSAPPFQYVELKRPGVHKVIDSREALGGSVTHATLFTTTPFAEANPKIVKAVRSAAEEAVDFVKTDPRAAAQAYKEVSGDRIPLDELVAILHEPGIIDGFRIDPQGTMIIAAHLHKIGTLKTMPSAWSDYYLPQSVDLNGS